MSGGDTIRLGLVGAGHWGRNYISTIACLDGIELARLASRKSTSRDLVDASCQISSSWRDLIEAGDLDGLIIATGPAIQGEIAIAAIRAGLPLMLEKPVATDVASVQRLLDLSISAGVPILVDHVNLFSGAFAALSQEIPRLGGLRGVRASRGSWGPFRADLRALWDWAPHDLAMCLDLVGATPERIEGHVLKAEHTIEGDGELIRIDLEFPSGIAAEITVGNLMEPPERLFTVVCQDGELVFDDLANDRLVRRTGRGKTTVVPLADDPPLSRAVTTFARGIAGGDISAFGLDLAVEVTRVIASAAQTLK